MNFLAFKKLTPSLEVRGSYPIYAGTFDAQSNILGGIKIQKQGRKFLPYADVLVGEGHLNYSKPRKKLPYPTSNSTVLGFGLGFDRRLSRSFSFKGDVQYQHYDNVLPAPSGSASAIASAIGLVYHFGDRN